MPKLAKPFCFVITTIIAASSKDHLKSMEESYEKIHKFLHF